MTIDELRAKVVAELRLRDGVRNDMAGIREGASSSEASSAWDAYFAGANYQDFEAADTIEGEVEALQWVVDLIDRESRPAVRVRPVRPA